MRKTLGITLTTAALLFGGAGVATAAPSTPMPSSTTTSLADDATTDHDTDKTGLWGLVGLLGLLGLTGLKRRNDPAAVAPGATGYGTAPRA